MSSMSTMGRVTSAASVGRPSGNTFYPSPFFDISRTYLPRSITETYEWCEHYATTVPQLSAVIRKLATFAVTDFIFESESSGQTTMWSDFFHTIDMRQRLIERGLDKLTYGNSFWSVSSDTVKYLICPQCKIREPATKRNYTWQDCGFKIKCKCGYEGNALQDDVNKASADSLRLIRWNPHHIVSEQNPVTQRMRHYYNMPNKLRNAIITGKRDVIENTPAEYIEAVKEKKAIMFRDDRLFHARRSSISRKEDDSGLGEPIVLALLKDIYLTQVLRKSQEAVALEHIVPLRVVYPQVSMEGNNVYAQVDLTRWQAVIGREITAWKKDPNHIANVPFPVGYQHIGGQGRAMLLHQELRLYYDQIIAGMGVPTGFFYGELQYSGGSVNMRAMENEFMGDRDEMIRFIEFVVDKVSAVLSWPKIRVRFKPFKAADDIQRASFDMNLANAKMISRSTFLASRDFDISVEMAKMEAELDVDSRMQRKSMLSQAQAQGEASLTSARYQAQAQTLMQSLMPPPPAPPGAEGMPPGAEGAPPTDGGGQQMSPGADVDSMMQEASMRARQLGKMSEVDREQALGELRGSNPQMFSLVMNNLHGMGMAQQAPNPEQRPPRASPDRAAI